MSRVRRPGDRAFPYVGVCAVLFGLAAGYSWFGTSRDFPAYRFFFDELRFDDPLDHFRFDPGFSMLFWTGKFVLGLPLEAVIAIVAAISLVLKFAFFLQFQRPLLAVGFYLCTWYPLHEYTQVRAAISIALCMLAVRFFLDGRIVAYVAVMAAAAALHSAAVTLALAVPAAWIVAGVGLRYSLPAICLVPVFAGLVETSLLDIAGRLNPLSESHILNVDGNRVNLLSVGNILTAALLGAIALAGSLKDRVGTMFFILCAVGLALGIAFRDVPIFSHRLRELFLTFLVPIAFAQRWTAKGTAQNILAITLAAWSFYAAVDGGLIGRME